MKKILYFALALSILLINSGCSKQLLSFKISNENQNIPTTTIDPDPIVNDIATPTWDWELMSDGTLYIFGTGNMPDWNYYSAPWYESRESIKAVIIDEGITSIGNYAFEGCEAITNVSIPNSVTRIGKSSFSACYSLTSIIIPNSVICISDFAFYGSKSLSNITIPDNVISIGFYAFTDTGAYTNSNNWNNGVLYIDNWLISVSSNITTCTISDTCRGVAGSAFYQTNNPIKIKVSEYNNKFSVVDGILFDKEKTSLIYCPSNCIGIDYSVPKGITNIGAFAFASCHDIYSITIPDTITTIGEYAFANCEIKKVYIYSLEKWVNINFLNQYSNPLCGEVDQGGYIQAGSDLYLNGEPIKNLEIPNGVTKISNHAFRACKNINEITLPDSVTIIGDGAFLASSITGINLGNGVTSIGYSAFVNCNRLSSIILPDCLKFIFDHAFDKCYSIKNVTIPRNVKYLGNNAFPLSTEILIDKNNTAYSSLDGVLFNKDKTLLMLCTGNSTNTEYIVPNTVTTIGERAFENCRSLESITIPASVTQIDYGAFFYCYNLTDVYYSGSEAEWNNISINSDYDKDNYDFNEENRILYAQIHYNCKYPI